MDNTKSTYEQSINNSITDALVEMEENKAVANTALDNIDRVLNDSDAKIVLSTTDPSYKINTKDTYNKSQDLGVIANNILVLAKASPTNTNVGQALDDYLKYLNKVFDSLNYCYGALENTIITSSFTQAELDALKTNISAQLTAVSAAIVGTQTVDQALSDATLSYDTKVSAAQDTLDEKQTGLDDAKLTAQNNLATAMTSGDQQIAVAQTKVDTNKEAWDYAEAQLTELKAPARSHDISLNQAKVKQAEAGLELIKNSIQDSIIKAPIDGTVTNIEYEVGEQTSATNPAVSILGENNFEVEVDISEADIAKIKLNNPAKITLDAFGDEVEFIGKIYFIEPAETVIQDVIYYKVKIQFLDQAPSATLPPEGRAGGTSNLENIKSGMTANIVLTTAKKENVLFVPSRAIVEKNGPSASSGQASKYVRILKNNKITEMPITTGLRGDGGMVEVIDGVKEGQIVVTQIKNNK